MPTRSPSWWRSAVAVLLAAVLIGASTAVAAPPVFERPVPLVDPQTEEHGAFKYTPAIATNGTGTWIVATQSGDHLGGTFEGGYHILFARSTDGGLSYASFAPLGGGGEYEMFPALAGDASGVWIAVWAEQTIFGERMLLARSADDGVTWTPGVVFYDGATWPSIATDGAGTWVAIWQKAIGPDRDIYVSRSTNGGLLWTPPLILNAEPLFDPKQDLEPRLYVSGGIWIAVWTTNPVDFGAENRDVLYARSTDGGATWSIPAPLSTTAYPDAAPDGDPRLASDGAGNWVAVWGSEHPIGVGGEGDILFARSNDGGATWTPPAALNTDATIDGGILDEQPSIAASPSGQYVATWRRRSPIDLGYGIDDDVFTAFSDDGGVTWSAPAPVSAGMTTDTGDDFETEMSYDPAGRWLALWTTDSQVVSWPPRRDRRIVTAFSDEPCGNGSLDPGEACDDGDRASGDADCCGRTCQLAPAGARCVPDADLCTHDRCDGAGTCGHVFEPRTVCKAPVVANASSLQIGIGGKPASTKLNWKWPSGAATSFFDFRPYDESSLALCLYDATGLIGRVDTPAGGLCGKSQRSCWDSHKGKEEYDGWDYKDPERTPNGVEKLSFRGGVGVAGATKFAIKAKGEHLVPPTIPAMGSALTAQLLSDTSPSYEGQCWGASYSTTDASKNDARAFKGKGD